MHSIYLFRLDIAAGLSVFIILSGLNFLIELFGSTEDKPEQNAGKERGNTL